MFSTVLFFVLIKGDNHFSLRRHCGSATKVMFFITVSVVRAFFSVMQSCVCFRRLYIFWVLLALEFHRFLLILYFSLHLIWLHLHCNSLQTCDLKVKGLSLYITSIRLKVPLKALKKSCLSIQIVSRLD